MTQVDVMYALVDTLTPDKVLELASGRAVYRSHATAVSAAGELLKYGTVPPGTKLRVRSCTLTPTGVQWV